MKRLILILTALLILAACGPGQPSAEEILEQSAATMSEVETLSFVIDRQGAPVLLDLGEAGAGQTIDLLGAEGVYSAPENVYAEVKIGAGNLITNADVVWNETGAYLQFPPFIPEYELIPLEEDFNAALIFDQEEGLPSILVESLQEPELVGEVDVDGIPSYQINATADGEDLAELAGGAVEPGDVDVEVFIDRRTNEVVRIRILEDEENAWQVDIFGYGEPVEIPVP